MNYVAKFIAVLIFCAAQFASADSQAFFQADEVADAEQSKTAKPPATEPDPIDTSEGAEKSVLGKQFAQLHLQDGSIIGGDIQLKQLHVKTEFGRLTVPLERVIKIVPGLNSRPELASQIEKHVNQLGSAKREEVQAASQALSAFGIKIKLILQQYEDDSNEVRSKNLAELVTRLEQAADEEGMSGSAEAMTQGDQIETADFTIVGEIEEKQFIVDSKFGQLTVQLGDIQLADRSTRKTKKEIRKTFPVPVMSFFQNKPYSTKIRVNKGDRISIKADGVMNWTNWSNSCSPDGLTNRGQWNGFNSGTLLARIGSDNSHCIKIGAKADFVAKKSGVLYLGVAMRDSYASNQGYNWTGEYKSKVTINGK